MHKLSTRFEVVAVIVTIDGPGGHSLLLAMANLVIMSSQTNVGWSIAFPPFSLLSFFHLKSPGYSLEVLRPILMKHQHNKKHHTHMLDFETI